MYIPEKKLKLKVETEIKKLVPVLSRWRIGCGEKSKGPAADILITAFYKSRPYYFCAELKRAGYPKYIREAIFTLKEFIKLNPKYYPLIIAPLMGEQAKKICDEHATGYMDFNGAIKIVSGGIFIQREGRVGKAFSGDERQSIFSPKAARITKALLFEPHKKWLQKDIVDKTELSKGMVSRIVNRMIAGGYLVEKNRVLTLSNFEDLFMAWVEETLKRRENRKNYYVWARNPKELMSRISDELSKRKIKHAFTQEAGASLVAPFSTFEIVSAYIESLDKFPADILSAEEAKRGFNLVVIEPPDEGIFIDARDIKGFKVVDTLQLYVDLKKNPLRGDKQAEHVLSIIKRGVK